MTDDDTESGAPGETTAGSPTRRAGSISLRRQMLAIGLTAFSVLLFEIAVTRILSVMLWYHWAFLSVSLAMVGLGAPGVWFSFARPSARVRNALLVAGGVSLPLAVAVLVSVSPHVETGQVLVCMAGMLVPFVCLGAATCILLLEAPGRRIAPVYAADLLGASVAALVVIPAMDRVPTPVLVSVLGVVPLAAAWVLGARWRALVPALGLVLGIVAWGEPIEVTRSKNYDEREFKPIIERWTSTARLTIFDGLVFWKHGQEGFGWGKGRKARKTTTPQYWLEQDGSAGTPITHFDGDLGAVSFMFDDVTAVAYEALEPDRVAIIGAGGGRDILAALVAGADSIDAVELNPATVDIVAHQLRDFTGDPYHHRGVHPHVSEGRAFLTRTDAHYDLIQISMIDSWAATAAGAFSLSENNLYTKESYRLYLSRLADGGVISTSRWSEGAVGVELPRLIVLAQAALRDEGVADPNRHLAVIRAGRVATVLVAKQPFDEDRIERIRSVADRRGFLVLYPVRHMPDDPQGLLQVMAEGPGELEAKGLDMSPPTDDRPFFFQVLPALRPVDRELAESIGFNAEAVYVLQVLMVVLCAITVVLFFAPFVVARWMPATPGRWRGSVYFAAIGLGFMLIEIPWLQRYILYLGHPSRAATVVLGCMLLGTGVGAMLSSRVGQQGLRRFGLLLPVVLAVVNLGLGGLFEATLGLPFAGRVLMTALVLVPIGVGMGMFFPLGMVVFPEEHKAWYWAVNGATGVLASVVSLAAAMAFGFTAVAWAGVVAYGVAWAVVRRP